MYKGECHPFLSERGPQCKVEFKCDSFLVSLDFELGGYSKTPRILRTWRTR